MRIYLLRHGSAEDRGPRGDDSPDRQLVKKGREQAAAAGALLQRMGVSPGRALCSPYDRARQTAEEALARLDDAPALENVSCLAPGGALGAALAAIIGGESDVLVVGHEPQLSEIALALAGDRGLLLDLRKGGMVELELVQRDPPRATLLGLLRPRHLR